MSDRSTSFEPLVRFAFGVARWPLDLFAASLAAVDQAIGGTRPPISTRPVRVIPENEAAATRSPRTAGAAAWGGDARPQPHKEDTRMSCTCDYCSTERTIDCPPVEVDKGLGGKCCIKVVQYVIVSSLSGIDDNSRVLWGPQTVAFSDDMTDADFTAWVIGRALRCDPNSKDDGEKCKALRAADPKYLRVAYAVLARFAESERDLEKAQVAALVGIERALIKK